MFVIWVLSAFLPIIRLGTTRDVSYAIFTAVIVFCLLTTTLLNYKIYVAVRHQANQIQALQVQQEAQNGEMANAARLRKFAFGTFFIYITFMVCYLPNTCRLVIFMISGDKYHYERFAILRNDSNFSKFISQSSDLLLEDETHSTRCHEHTEENAAKPQLRKALYFI